MACLVAGFLGAVSAITPWWYTSTSSSGTSSTAYFYPGGNIYAGGGGGGGITSYVDYGLPSVGQLYAAAFVGVLALVAVSWVVAGYALGVSRGKWDSVAGRRAARMALLAAIVVGALLSIALPTAQPSLYRADDPLGSCASAAPPGPCGSFWGTTHGASMTTVWGAGLGWWLDLALVVLLLPGLALAAFASAPSPEPARRRERA